MGFSSSKKKDDIIRQGHIDKHPHAINKKQMKKIFDQMNQSIFKIKNGEINGTGFICLIPYPDEIHQLPVLITCNHVLDINDINKQKEIILFIDNREIVLRIREDRKIYTSNKDEYDITIIEIKKDDYIYKNNFLEIDSDVYKDDLDTIYKDQSAYIIHYPLGGDCEYSLDTISSIEPNNIFIYHFCATEEGSSGGPILNLETFKVMGIHTGEHKSHKYNVGTVIKHPIEYFNKLFPAEIEKNEIIISLQVRDIDVNKKIYFLDNTDYFDEETNKRVFHDNLKELNENNVKIYIDEIPYSFCKYFIPKKKGIYTIKIEFNILMKDCSYMFYDCENLRNINLSSFNAQNVINMNNMFSNCFNLLSINILRLNVKNVKDMSYMFSNCQSLKTINLLGFNTENVENMKGMFYNCLYLEKINVSTFNTSKVIDMSGMFNICPNLLNIDLSSFDIRDETNIDGMFPPMNVCVAPPFNSPAFNMHIIDAPQKVKVNEKSYDKFLKILKKEKIYK